MKKERERRDKIVLHHENQIVILTVMSSSHVHYHFKLSTNARNYVIKSAVKKKKKRLMKIE